MKRAAVVCAMLVASITLPARADEAGTASPAASEVRLVARARELLDRARMLDETAAAEDRSVADLVARLPNLRVAAKAARDRAGRAKESDPERETLVAKAEDLEVDVAVSEAEVSAKRRAAVEDRRAARELRARAVRVLKDGIVEESAQANLCDPAFRYTLDGRKIYRLECLK